LALSICLLLACKHSKLRINKSLLLEYAGAEKGIIVSCIRCTCIDEIMAGYKKEILGLGVAVFADTTCVSQVSDIKYTYLSQSKIDSLYLRNYNMILFDISNGKNDYYLIKTEESNNFKSIVGDFFK
jgi:hypothetical protein